MAVAVDVEGGRVTGTLVARLPLEVDGAEATVTSLSLPAELRVNDWERIGGQLELAQNANLWWIADWAAYGDRCYRKQYPLLLEKMFARESLASLASIARSVEPLRRRKDLSFSHHREVAPLPPDEQTEWLSDAFDHGWSVRELRERIAAARRGVRRPSLPSLTVRAPAELASLFTQAADRAHAESPAAWALAVLEREARQVLELEAA